MKSQFLSIHKSYIKVQDKDRNCLHIYAERKQKIKQGTGSISLLRFVGYGLLVLALLDLIEMLVPVRLLDPV